MLEFSEKLTLRPREVGEPDVLALRGAGLSDRDILDLVQVVSYFNYTNRRAVALGVESESAPARGIR